MRCYYCYQEYRKDELVLTKPSICPFCILGHGGMYPNKSYRTEEVIKTAINRLLSPRMQHRLKCRVPSRMSFRETFRISKVS